MAVMQATFAVIDQPEVAEVVFRPHRTRVLEAFRAPTTTADAARALDMPRQQLGYHVRALKARGLLRSVRNARVGNFVAEVLETSAGAYALSPAALGPLALEPEVVRDRFSTAYLAALAGRTLSDLGALRAEADAAGLKLATLSFESEVRVCSPEAQAAFAADLEKAVRAVVAQHHDASPTPGRTFRLTLGAYPKRSPPTPKVDGGTPPRPDATIPNPDQPPTTESP